MSKAKTRHLAIRVLSDVFSDRTTPKSSLENAAVSLDRRDRSFLMEIVYGVLRTRDPIDWVLQHFLKNPGRLEDFTLNNLRAAVYQIYFMRVPHFAVVHEAVNIEKTGGMPGLVNAVLRNVLKHKESYTLPVALDDPADELALNTSHPKWLIRRWIRRFGYEEAALLARIHNEIPHLTLRANTLKTDREALIRVLQDKGIHAEPTQYSPDGVILRSVHSPFDLPLPGGLCVVQDEASQLISYLLAPRPGERILDACAAPGGKATHIAQLMGDEGEIVAVDRDADRVKRLRSNIRSLGIQSIKVIQGDLADLQDHSMFDRVLLDAPCSALGVIRKNPDVRYRRSRKDLALFHCRQSDLLLKAAALLRAGGTLVYSVCSMEPEEGEEVIKEFLKANENFRIIEDSASVVHALMGEGYLQLYPQRHHTDGFFGVAVCRTG